MTGALLALIALLVTLRAEGGFDQYEAALQAVCDHLVTVHNKGPVSETCQSIDGCSNNIKDLLMPGCNTDYGNETECGCNGRRVSFDLAITRLAPEASYSDPAVVQDVCLSRQLDKVYRKQMDANPGILKMYFGFFSGLHRTYPPTDWRQITETAEDLTKCRRDVDECPSYDPRIRAWFIAAAVGPKDLILVLDVSGSMANHGRISLLRSAALAVIKTLTDLDYFGIVAFSSSGEVWRTQLQRANSANRTAAIRFIEGLVPNGGTDFEVAFKATFEMMSLSTREGASTGCKTAILFLTDGKSDASPMARITDFYESEPNMFVFSYTLGNEAQRDLPRKIACHTGGVYKHVADSGDLSAAMTTYWRVFSGGRGTSQNDNKVFWSEPYQDALGLGEVRSPAQKCQAGQTLVGVASLTINKNRDPSVFELPSRTAACPYFTILPDELEEIRGGTCGDEIDSASRHLLGTVTVLSVLTVALWRGE